MIGSLVLFPTPLKADRDQRSRLLTGQTLKTLVLEQKGRCAFLTFNHMSLALIGVWWFTTRWDGLWAMFGGFLPDLPVILYGARALYRESRKISSWFDFKRFNEMLQEEERHDHFAHHITSCFHSIVIWGGLFVLAYATNVRQGILVGLGAILHLAADFFVHKSDAHSYFWPVSFKPIQGFWSAWEEKHGGHVIMRAEFAAVLVGLALGFAFAVYASFFE